MNQTKHSSNNAKTTNGRRNVYYPDTVTIQEPFNWIDKQGNLRTGAKTSVITLKELRTIVDEDVRLTPKAIESLVRTYIKAGIRLTGINYQKRTNLSSREIEDLILDGASEDATAEYLKLKIAAGKTAPYVKSNFKGYIKLNPHCLTEHLLLAQKETRIRLGSTSKPRFNTSVKIWDGHMGTFKGKISRDLMKLKK